jgi:hypothetical protein
MEGKKERQMKNLKERTDEMNKTTEHRNEGRQN